MRKSLHFVFAIALVAIVAGPAFSGPTSEGGMPTLVLDSRLWSPPEQQEFVINEVLKPFGEENGVKVALSIFQDEDLLKRQKVQSETGNQTTDIVIAYASRFTDWVNEGYVEDLTDCTSSNNSDKR